MPGRALAVLCLTQVTAWGVLFYAFPVLPCPIGARASGRPGQAEHLALVGGLTAPRPVKHH